MMPDILDQDCSDDWTRRFLSSPNIRKIGISITGSIKYYGKMDGNNIVELYSTTDDKKLTREPIRNLLMLREAIPSLDGFDFHGVHYSHEFLLKEEAECIRFENS